EGRLVADLDSDSKAILVRLVEEWIASIVIDRLAIGPHRLKNGHRFTGREHMVTHVAFGRVMLARSHQFIEGLLPILHRLVVYSNDHILYDRRARPLVGESEVNIRRIATIELKNRPNRRAHLLALHVGSVSGNTQRQETNESRDDRSISAGRRLRFLFRHGAELIAA